MKIRNLALPAVAMLAIAPGTHAQQSSPENYLRSSLYTIILTSDNQDSELVQESQKQSEGGALIKGLAGNNNASDPTEIIKAPQTAFLSIAIPEQFNDHNLGMRKIAFDPYYASMTDADKADAEAMSGKKKGGFGKSLLGGAKDVAGVSNYPTGGYIDSYGPWAIMKELNSKHTADSIVAKWYGYDASRGESKWDPNFSLISERGLQGASEAEKDEAARAGLTASLMQQRGMDLVPNTYVLVVNPRFRSNQAIVAEAEAAANVVGGAFGGVGALAAKAASTVAAAAAGDGFTVQAHTYLFKLDWDNDVNNRFANEIWGQNKSVDDLIASGMCKLVYVGHEKAGSNVRQSLTNKTSQADLIATATTRAIDQAIAKLQVKHEGFRTAFPVFKDNGDGTLTARVGMKEGITKGDEYEILEASLDPKTNATVYKSVGKVKAVDKQIWDNRAGLDSEEAETLEAKLGYTTFSGAKKGQNYGGYFLRLKKKK